MSSGTTHQGPTAPGPVVIDIGSDAKRSVAVGGAVASILGLVALASALTGQVTGGTGATVGAAVIGGILLLIGVLPLLAWRTLSRPRSLVFDQHGIRMDDPQGKPWALAWDELAAIAISRTAQRRVKPTDHIMRRVLVRLDMFPADAGVRGRHPEMEHLWELHRVQNGYRLPFGSAPQYIATIDGAMRRYAPSIYQGVKDEGFTVGLR